MAWRAAIVVAVAIHLSACNLIPSTWDNNQSVAIVNTVVAVDAVDCEQFTQQSVSRIRKELDWFVTYSQLRGGQDDVIALIEPFTRSLDGLSAQQFPSVAYCSIKKEVLKQQIRTIAKTVMERNNE